MDLLFCDAIKLIRYSIFAYALVFASPIKKHWSKSKCSERYSEYLINKEDPSHCQCLVGILVDSHTLRLSEMILHGTLPGRVSHQTCVFHTGKLFYTILCVSLCKLCTSDELIPFFLAKYSAGLKFCCTGMGVLVVLLSFECAPGLAMGNGYNCTVLPL